ncbi:hypothetical protein BDZ94DRAFT_1300742 [Collybia nuda]|uniref:Uncharacterized protein n=1 Tax=Collybia nuda TaxID=64659 RepID=A0A9P5XX32_9AGAR|nr:hypothetical protein BDZ94DRAFT_1300742 [Collybia nuda]
MTPEEAAFIGRAGDTLRNNLTLFIPESLLFGAFLYLFSHSTVIFMRRGLRSWPSRFMFITSLTSFLLIGIHWATYCATLYIAIKGFFIEDPSNLGDVKRPAIVNLRLFPFLVAQNWIDQLAIYISDGIVIWRAWALFSEQIWIMVLPVALFLGTITTGLAYLALMVSLPAFIAVQNREPVPAFKLVTANLALSFTANAVTTLLITYRLWAHRKTVGIKALGSLSSVQKVLVALIESGVAYCVLQLIRTVLYCYPGRPQTARYFASATVLSLASSATSMYPTVVIMLVNQQRTLVECFGLDPGSRSRGISGDEEVRVATPGHLSFARSATHRTTQAETFLTQHSDVSSMERGETDGNFIKNSEPKEPGPDRQTKTFPF